MVESSRMYPSNVRQPWADVKKNNPFPCCIRAVDRSGRYESSYCANRGDDRYYHEWTNAMELTRGGEIQCGRPSNYFCNHGTYYNIAGFRNVCPIAGCSGTYFQPSILQLELSKAHLANYGIIDGSEVHSITLNYNHRSLGVDVATSRTYSSWGPNFCGFDKYPDLKVVTMYITDKNGVLKGNVVTFNENPPLKGYAGVSARFEGITYNDIVDGHINIEYQRNLSTSPGNIYIKDLFITTEYTNAFPYMEGSTDFTSLYVSKTNKCMGTGVHTIDVGYRNKAGKLPLSKSPKDLRDSVQITVPDGVTYTKTKVQDHFLKFTIKDQSNKVGTKNVIYTLKDDPSKIITFSYEAKRRKPPEIRLNYVFTKNTPYLDNCVVVKAQDPCIDKIDFYENGFDTQPIFTFKESSNHFNFNNTNNLLTKSAQEAFHNAIVNLPCGKHQLWMDMNDGEERWGPFTVTVNNPKYEFKVLIGTQSQDDDNQLDTDLHKFTYIQNKTNKERILKIQRIDNIVTTNTPKFELYTDTNYQNKTQNTLNTINKGLQKASTTFNRGEIKQFDISTQYPGKYTFGIKEISEWASTCQCINDVRDIDIKPNHKQNHDVLFVRGEDSTSFEYDYFVAWEGDNFDEPIHVSDFDAASTFDNIKICVEREEFFTGLSQIGVAKLRVTNKSKKTLKNIRIELNVLSKDDDGNDAVTLDEFFEADGIFRYLKDNFYEYNKHTRNNLSVVNLPGQVDNDNIGEENVEIIIHQLEYDEDEKTGDTIEIKIPFMCKDAKTVKIQPLIFEEPFPIYTYQNCDTKQNPLDHFKLTVYDSILTDLTIEGETDLLEPNTEYKCPLECFTTELTYKIRNIDSSSTEKPLARTKITNDANLIPYKFEYKDGKATRVQTAQNILDQDPLNDNVRVEWLHNEKIKIKQFSRAVIDAEIKFPKHDKYIIQQRTNMKGEVTFYFNIPNDIKTSYTLKKLLKEVVKFKYKGNFDYQASTLYINNKNELINTIEGDKKKHQVFFDYEQTYKKYKPGDTVSFSLELTYAQKYLDNTIIFHSNIQDVGKADSLKVYYKICNITTLGKNEYNEAITKYNQGILTTTFETDDYQLIENKVSKDVYVGLDTRLIPKVNIEKRLVEQQEINIVNIQLTNEIRDNKNVKCWINIGPFPNGDAKHNEPLLGEYEILNVEIDDGNYNIAIDINNQKNIKWLIGEMKADSSTNAKIILKGKEIGLSDIKVDTSDFIREAEEKGKNYHFGEQRCSC